MVDGGRNAASGFEYQYLRTLEAMLASLDFPDIGSCVVEGDPSLIRAGSADSVDYQIIDLKGAVLVAAQVKSTRTTRTLSLAQGLAIFDRLIRSCSAQKYVLETNITQSQEMKILGASLKAAKGDPEVLRAVLAGNDVGDALADGSALTMKQLSKCEVRYDSRSSSTMRESIVERIVNHRRLISKGTGRESAGLLTGYLVSVILQKAATPAESEWPLEGFRKVLEVDNKLLVSMAGRRDWGIISGPMPSIPSLARKGYLDSIHSVVSSPSEVPLQVRQVVLSGLSGIGKSSLAAGYVGAYAHYYERVLWVDSSNLEALDVSYRIIYRDLALGAIGQDDLTVRESVLSHLANADYRWLIIFDDAMDERDLQSWLPSVGQGVVLVTTNDAAGWRRAVQIPVDRLDRKESLAMLIDRLGMDPKRKSERRLINELADVLEDWPLALEVASGYIRSTGLRIKDIGHYVSQVRTAAIDDDHSLPAGYPRTLRAAVIRSLQKLDDRYLNDLTMSEVTKSAVWAAAHLAPQQIPLHLLAAVRIHPDELAAREPYFVSPDIFDVLRLNRALLSTSLFSQDAELPAARAASLIATAGYALRVNTITQDIIQTSMRGELAEITLGLAAVHLEKWLVTALDRNEGDLVVTLLPHCMILAAHCRSRDIAWPAVALLHGNTAAALAAINANESADKHLRCEIGMLEDAGNPDPALLAQARLQLATSLLRNYPGDQESHDEAHDLMCQITQEVEDGSQGSGSSIELLQSLVTQALVILRTQPRLGPDNDRIPHLELRLSAVMDRLPDHAIFAAKRSLEEADSLLRSLEEKDIARVIAICGRWIPEDQPLGIRLEALRLTCEARVRLEDWDESRSLILRYLELVGPVPLLMEQLENFVFNVGLILAVKSLEEDQSSSILSIITGSPQFAALLFNAQGRRRRRLHTLLLAAGADASGLDPERIPASMARATRDIWNQQVYVQGGVPSYEADLSWAYLSEVLLANKGGVVNDNVNQELEDNESEENIEAGSSFFRQPPTRVRGLPPVAATQEHAKRRVEEVMNTTIVEARAAWSMDETLRIGVLERGPLGMGMILPESAAEPSASPFPVMLLETPDLLVVALPGVLDGNPFEIQIESIAKQGFPRVGHGFGSVETADGWELRLGGGWVRLVDGTGGEWAKGRCSPSDEWMTLATQDGWVLTLYGPELGVGLRRGVGWKAAEALRRFRHHKRLGMVAGALVRLVVVNDARVADHLGDDAPASLTNETLALFESQLTPTRTDDTKSTARVGGGLRSGGLRGIWRRMVHGRIGPRTEE